MDAVTVGDVKTERVAVLETRRGELSGVRLEARHWVEVNCEGKTVVRVRVVDEYIPIYAVLERPAEDTLKSFAEKAEECRKLLSQDAEAIRVFIEKLVAYGYKVRIDQV